MNDRRLADVVAGALACVSVLAGCVAMFHEAELSARRRRLHDAARWALPNRRRRRSPEDDCRHCAGSGTCPRCAPAVCRVCKGNGLQPHDDRIALRLSALWDGAA